MADTKISALPSSTTPLAGTEVLPIVQSSTTKKVTVADLTAGRTVNADTLNATNVEVTNVKAKDGTAAVSIADSTGVVTIDSSILTTTDINGGAIDGTVIGGTTPAAGTFTTLSDSLGSVRAIPQSGSAKTGSYTLAVGDVGQFIEVGSGGSITVPDATFATGDVVSIFNNTSGTVTLTMSITTAYIGGADVDEATIDLATRGVATVLFISGTVCVVNGNVS